jgi:DNA-binding NtrC family response regulator
MTTKPKRVLIVDDEEDLTWSVSKNLARDHRQYELICVNSGSEALHVLNQIPVDLVVSMCGCRKSVDSIYSCASGMSFRVPG